MPPTGTEYALNRELTGRVDCPRGRRRPGLFSMTEAFNPYRKWLGIPEQDQPPHHYRLLGIEVFESDPDVISNAADGRMAQVKNYQAGRYSQESQRLLNEIAAAKVCLLNAAKKAEYDLRLRQSLAARNGVAAPPRGEGVRPVAESPELEFAPVRASSLLPRGGRNQSRWAIPLALAAGSVAVAALAVYWNRSGDGTPAEVAVAAPSPREHHSPLPRSVAPQAPAPPKQSREEARPAPAETGRERPPASAEAAPETPPPEPESAEEPPPAEPAPPEEPEPPPLVAKKAPVPGEAELRSAEARLRELFGREIAAAKTAAQKLDLAARLTKAGETTENDAAARCVLLRTACEMAAAAGEIGEAFDMADRVHEEYAIDAVGMKADLLAKAVEANRMGEEALARLPAVVAAAAGLIDEAVAADEFDAAIRASRLAAAAARIVKDAQSSKDLDARTRDIERLKLRYASVQKALDALDENPDDAEANLTVGQWRCFVKGDWANGLRFLEKSGDEKLAKPAAEDLAAPESAKEQLALADAWWEAAEREPGPAKAAIQARAGHWYEKALPRLAGLDKRRVENRLEALSAAGASPADSRPAKLPKLRGAVESGNVALASNGATVEGIPDGPARLLDGNLDYGLDHGFAIGRIGQPFTVTLRQVYQLREIRMLLWDRKPRSYNYIIATSVDGREFTPLVDRSQGIWTGWQQITFPPRPVKMIRVYPVKKIWLDTKASVVDFTVVELEAYCVPPGNRGAAAGAKGS